MGRRSKLEEFTDKEKATMLGYLRAGNYRVVACAAVGICSKTLANWEKRAADGEEPYSTFVEQVERVEALAEVESVGLIALARQGRREGADRDENGTPLAPFVLPPDWKAAAFMLERRGKQRWAPVQKSEVTGKDGGAIQIEGAATPEAAAQLTREAFGEHARKLTEEVATDPEEGGDDK